MNKKIKFELKEDEIKYLIEYATKQYDGAPANHSTRFPTIHVVENCVKLASHPDYTVDGIEYSYEDDHETTWDTLEELIEEDLKEKLINNFAEELMMSEEKFNILFDTFNKSECRFKSKHRKTLKKYDEVIETMRNLEDLINSDDVEELNSKLSDYDLEEYSVKEYYYQEVYEPEAYFFTRSSAEDYMKYQAHNLDSKARIYTRYMGYSNKGDFPVICEMLLRLGNQLNQNEELGWDEK